jgi:2-dehydropantoate 2-reductase
MRTDLPVVQEKGLTLRSAGSPDLELHPPGLKAYASPGEIGPVDLVIIALKTTSNDALETLIPPLLGERTALLTLQNGLGNEAFLARRFGAERVMGGLCFVCLNRVSPGVIEHYGHGTISIGEYEGAPRPRTEAFAAELRRAGIETHVVEDLINERWRKLIWNIPFNGLSVVAGGITTQEILADPGLEALVRGLMRETLEIAAANGHAIPDSYIDFQMERTPPMGPYKPSSLLDYQGRRPIEVESIWGEPYRQALSAGVNAGRLEALYFLIRKLAAANLR